MTFTSEALPSNEHWGTFALYEPFSVDRVREYIPPRPIYPKRTDGAQRVNWPIHVDILLRGASNLKCWYWMALCKLTNSKESWLEFQAVTDFHNQVGVVANLILDEYRWVQSSLAEELDCMRLCVSSSWYIYLYSCLDHTSFPHRDLFGEELKNESDSRDALEKRYISSLSIIECSVPLSVCFQSLICHPSRRQSLIYHLNSSGRYFAFKEQLKHSVVKIVREKYLKTTNFTDKDDLQVS